MDNHKLTSKQILKKYWGYEGFRFNQEEIIDSVLKGNDTIALLPTGGGKSICFQVPALLKEGICLVISPLISLIEDQMKNLKSHGIRSISLSNTESFQDIERLYSNVYFGNYKFVFLSPERFGDEAFRHHLSKWNVSIIAIDEAHCISNWGMNFRPSYLKLGEIKNLLPKVPIIALTATATKQTISDISEILKLDSPNIFKNSFKRDNLEIKVQIENAHYKKLLKLLKFDFNHQSLIIYCRRREETKLISDFLNQNNITSSFYHARLSKKEKEKAFDLWKKDKIKVIVCTTAFGMGIDKPDVRAVIHTFIPSSLEEYYQQIGRAGRDGKTSKAILLISKEEKDVFKKIAIDSFVYFKEVEKLYKHLKNHFQITNSSNSEEVYGLNEKEFLKKYKSKISKKLLDSGLKVLANNDIISLFNSHKNSFKLKVLEPSLLPESFQSILREHDNLTSDFTEIKSDQINENTDLVFKLLEVLSKKNIVKYQTPNSYSVGFNYPQEPKNLFKKLKEQLNQNNKVEKFRFRKIYDWVREEKQCRKQLILEYFGENSKPCGKCDYCLRNNSSGFPVEQNISLEDNILLLIKQNQKVPLSDLLIKFTEDKNLIKKAVKRLIDKKKIAFQNSTNILMIKNL